MQAIFAHLPVLLKMSGEASILIVLVLAAQWLFGRRLKPRWRHALWLPAVTHDKTLSELMDKLHAVQQKYTLATNNSASANETKASLDSEIETLNRQIDECVAGIMASSENQVKSEKAALEAFRNAAAHATTNGQAEALHRAHK